MSLGFDRDVDLVNLGDTAEITVEVYTDEDSPFPDTELVGVVFTIQHPDGTKVSGLEGEVMDTGQGYLRYATTTQTGQYLVVATFTTVEGRKKSVRADFEVIDPFNPPAPSPEEVLADAVWMKLRDCFDAEDEGPWLRDMTLNVFNKSKMQEFSREALFDINQQNPPTDFALSTFVHSDGTQTLINESHFYLLVHGTFLAVLRHLIRSYVEQPQPQGAQVVYEDRRDYLQRWQTIYQIELAQYQRELALWKRQFLGLGSTRGLLSTKAGRLIPAPMRTRYIGRGYG